MGRPAFTASSTGFRPSIMFSELGEGGLFRDDIGSFSSLLSAMCILRVWLQVVSFHLSAGRDHGPEPSPLLLANLGVFGLSPDFLPLRQPPAYMIMTLWSVQPNGSRQHGSQSLEIVKNSAFTHRIIPSIRAASGLCCYYSRSHHVILSGKYGIVRIPLTYNQSQIRTDWYRVTQCNQNPSFDTNLLQTRYFV